ncbi:unnamed protein product [Auanema sp. JU1783]|nr:unnamed protein product [Auanema sp. JU1783]
MNVLIQYGDITRNPLYNCSAMYTTSPERERVKRPTLGLSVMGYGAITLVLYSLALIVMRRKAVYQFTCYKIMFCLGFSDMTSSIINNFIMGYYIYDGISFCDYPNILYTSGCFNMAGWSTSCFFCLLLVLNRVLDIVGVRRSIMNFFFDPLHLKLIISLGYLYGSYFIFIANPPLFSSRLCTSILDPLIYLNKANDYTCKVFVFNNIVVVATTCSLYTFYCIFVSHRFHELSNLNTSTHRKLQQQIFAQVTIMCCLHFSCSVIFTLLQFITIPLALANFINVVYQITTGAPAVVYILLNKTIRQGIAELFGQTQKLVFSKVFQQLHLKASIAYISDDKVFRE